MSLLPDEGEEACRAKCPEGDFVSLSTDPDLCGGAALTPPPEEGGGGGGGFLPRLIPVACTREGAGTCGLPELIQVGINLARLILAISGSLALLMFVYGGFKWLTAAGVAERVDEGKKILTGAVIGLIIIFGAATIINFAQQALGGVGGTGGVEEGTTGSAPLAPNTCSCACSGALCLVAPAGLFSQAADGCVSIGGTFNNNDLSCSVGGYTQERCDQAEQQLNNFLRDYPISAQCTFTP